MPNLVACVVSEVFLDGFNSLSGVALALVLAHDSGRIGDAIKVLVAHFGLDAVVVVLLRHLVVVDKLQGLRISQLVKITNSLVYVLALLFLPVEHVALRVNIFMDGFVFECYDLIMTLQGWVDSSLILMLVAEVRSLALELDLLLLIHYLLVVPLLTNSWLHAFEVLGEFDFDFRGLQTLYVFDFSFFLFQVVFFHLARQVVLLVLEVEATSHDTIELFPITVVEALVCILSSHVIPFL